MKLSILGAGKMGQALGRRALAQGHEVAVWNRSRDKTLPLEAAGAYVHQQLRDAVAGCEAALLVLSDDEAVLDVCLGQGRLLDVLGSEAALINVSTVAPATVVSLRSHSRSSRVIDAPIMGTPAAVLAGNARFFLAGDSATIQEFTQLWRDLAEHSYICGDLGRASVLKLISNSLMLLHLSALAEICTLARSNGIEDELLKKVLGESAVTSSADRLRLDSLLSAEHNGWFRPALALKDLRLGLALDLDKKLNLLLGNAAAEHLEGLVRDSRDWPDVAAVIEQVAKRPA